MADHGSTSEREEIHLPGSSILPLVAGIGITITLLGLIWSWWIVLFGGLILLYSAVRWIRTVREDMANLPTQRHR